MRFYLLTEIFRQPTKIKKFNRLPDCICKLVEFDGYGINDFVFEGLNHLLGPYTIDRFACSYNGELPRLNSLFFSAMLLGCLCLRSKLGLGQQLGSYHGGYPLSHR